jgi:hypothetical protein
VLDAATVRRLAVRADVDPRTIQKVYEGLPVRGMAGRRARGALAEAGLAPWMGPASPPSPGRKRRLRVVAPVPEGA